jgi:hypothetical protein
MQFRPRRQDRADDYLRGRGANFYEALEWGNLRCRETGVTAPRLLGFCGYQAENFRAVGQSNKTAYIDSEAKQIGHDLMNSPNPESPQNTVGLSLAHGKQEVRCAVRFPLSLPVVLSAGANEIAGLTRNISASGVLFALGEALPVGQDVNFSMRMPRAVLGATQDVLVHCKGRVVRCSSSHNEHLAAATIDDYRFAEH